MVWLKTIRNYALLLLLLLVVGTVSVLYRLQTSVLPDLEQSSETEKTLVVAIAPNEPLLPLIKTFLHRLDDPKVQYQIKVAPSQEIPFLIYHQQADIALLPLTDFALASQHNPQMMLYFISGRYHWPYQTLKNPQGLAYSAITQGYPQSTIALRQSLDGLTPLTVPQESLSTTLFEKGMAQLSFRFKEEAFSEDPSLQLHYFDDLQVWCTSQSSQLKHESSLELFYRQWKKTADQLLSEPDLPIQRIAQLNQTTPQALRQQLAKVKLYDSRELTLLQSSPNPKLLQKINEVLQRLSWLDLPNITPIRRFEENRRCIL